MKKSKVLLFNILGLIILGLLVIGFALLTNVEPGQGKEKEKVDMNAEEKVIATDMEPVVHVIFDETRQLFVALDEEFARIDIELERGPEAKDDRLLSGFIFEILREGIVTAGEVTLHYTEAPAIEEKEKF